jgi:hypothetical protein
VEKNLIPVQNENEKLVAENALIKIELELNIKSALQKIKQKMFVCLSKN